MHRPFGQKAFLLAGLLTCLLALLAAPGAALAAEGDLLWTQPYNSGGVQADYGYDVVVDSGGNIYAVGRQGTNGGDMFLRQYDSTGVFQWAQIYNSAGTQSDYGYDVALDSGGNIYVTGFQTTNGTDMFLRKYDSLGNFQWMQTYDSGGIQVDIGYGVAVDLGGNIYVTGYQETNGLDMFLQKYDSTGALQWTQTYNSGGIQGDSGSGVAVDTGGNIYVTGYQQTNGEDMFVQKYDSTGALQWTQTYNSGGTQYDRGTGVAVDSSNNIYITGYQQTNAYDMFLRKYNPSGVFLWMQTYNSAGIQADYGFDIAVDPGGNIYVAGQQGTNGWDILLRKYASAGAFQWMQTYNSAGTQGDSASGIVVDSNNNIDIVGYQQTNGNDAVLLQYDGGGGGPGPSGVDCGVRMYDGTATINLSCENPPVSPLRIQKGATTYGIQLVPTADPNASKLRIQIPGGVRALRKQ